MGKSTDGRFLKDPYPHPNLSLLTPQRIAADDLTPAWQDMEDVNVLEGALHLHAFYETNLTGSNNDFALVQRAPGAATESVVIAVAGLNTALSLSYASHVLTINSATNGSGTATSTASEIVALIKATPAVWAVFHAELKTGNDGTGAVVALSSTPLGDVAAATLTTALTGTQNDLTYTAKAAGVAGNSITVTYVDPGGATATLGVVVAGNDITVNLGRASSAINSTAALVAAAIAASSPANALVGVANATGNDGTGLVTAMAQTPLAGAATLDVTLGTSIDGTNELTVAAFTQASALAHDPRQKIFGPIGPQARWKKDVGGTAPIWYTINAQVRVIR